jgi:hypothetical protein
VKRHTETTKWQDPWFRKLSGHAKLLWYFLIDQADPAGVCEIDYELAAEDCKIAITPAHMAELGNRVQLFGGAGEKVLLRKFIPFQYGSLSDACFPHKRVFEAIKKHGLIEGENGEYFHPAGTEAKKLPEAPNPKPKPAEEKPKAASKAKPETRSEFDSYFREMELLPRDAEYAWDHWESKGWKNGKDAIKDWKATVRAWKSAGYWPSQKSPMTNEKQWAGATAAKPAWLPDHWRDIAAAIVGPEALNFSAHTQVPTEHRHAFEMACRGNSNQHAA